MSSTNELRIFQSLAGEIQLLVECIETEEAPLWLDTFLSLNDGELRRSAMLAKARELVEERMAINIASEIPDATDSLQNLIAQIDAAENPPNSTDATNE